MLCWHPASVDRDLIRRRMLDTTQRQALDEGGWIVKRTVIDGTSIQALRAAADACCASARAAGSWPRPEAAGPAVVQLPGAVRSDPVLDAWMRGGTLGALGRSALDAGRVRLLQDAVLHKPAGCAGVVPWHRDHTYVGYLCPPRVVSIRVALTPSCAESRCLRVLDGSHRWPIVAPVEGGAQRIPRDALPPDAEARRAECEQLVPLEAGDVSVHGCLLYHASGTNPTLAPRSVLVFHVFDDTCTVDRDRMTSAMSARMVTDDAGHLRGDAFPLL